MEGRTDGRTHRRTDAQTRLQRCLQYKHLKIKKRESGGHVCLCLSRYFSANNNLRMKSKNLTDQNNQLTNLLTAPTEGPRGRAPPPKKVEWKFERKVNACGMIKRKSKQTPESTSKRASDRKSKQAFGTAFYFNTPTSFGGFSSFFSLFFFFFVVVLMLILISFLSLR